MPTRSDWIFLVVLASIIAGLLLFTAGFVTIDRTTRTLWYMRLVLCRWTYRPESSRPSSARRRCQGDVPSLSSSEEDNIRDAYLTEKLQAYTQTLTADNIRGPQSQNVGRSSSEKQLTDSRSSLEKEGGDVNVSLTKKEGLGSTVLQGGEEEEEEVKVWLPAAGQASVDDTVEHLCRTVAASCTVCLSPLELDDCVSWAGQATCPHVFHTHCIKDWLVASGRKHLKLQQKRGDLLPDQDPAQAVTQVPMLCPCCRQPFLKPDDKTPAAIPSPASTGSDAVSGTSRGGESSIPVNLDTTATAEVAVSTV